MAFNLENMTIDYKKMLRMVPADRATLAQSGQVSDLISSLTPGQLVNLFPRYYRDQLPDIGKSIGSLGGVLSDPPRYVGGGGGGGGGGGDGGGTVPYVPPELSTEKQAEILAKAGIDVTAITGAISAEGLSIDDERVKVLRNLSDEEMAKSGLERVTSEDGRTIIKKVAPEALQLSDEAAIDKFSRTFPPTTFSPRERATLDFIAKREGASDPNIVFGGERYKERLGLDKKPLTEHTISEVLNGIMPKLRELSKNDGFGRRDDGKIVGTSAVGSGQMIEGTLIANLRALGIPEAEWDTIKLDKNLQERLTLQNFKSSGIGDPNAPPSTWNQNRLGAQYESLNQGRGHPGMTQAEAAAIENASSEKPIIQQNVTPQEAKQKLAELETQQEQQSLTQTLYKKQTQGQPTALEGKMRPVGNDYDSLSNFWSQRSPRTDMKDVMRVDPDLLKSAAEGIQMYEAANPQYRVEVFGPSGGARDSGSMSNHGIKSDGTSKALDYVIIDRETGKQLVNLGREGGGQGYSNQVGGTGLGFDEMTKLHGMVRVAQEHFAPHEKDYRHGTGWTGGDVPFDAMHGDIRGDALGAYDWEKGYTPAFRQQFGMKENFVLGNEGRIKDLGQQLFGQVDEEGNYTNMAGFTQLEDGNITVIPKQIERETQSEAQSTVPATSPVNADPVTSALSRVEGQPSEAIPVPVSPIDPVRIPSDTQQTTTPSAAPAPVANRPEVRSFASGGTVPMTPGENVAGINTDTGKLEFMSNDRELYTKDDQGNLRIDPSTIRQEDQKAEIAPAEPQRQEEPNQPSQRRPEQPMPVSTPDPNFLETMSSGSMSSSPSQLRALNRARLYNENSGSLVNGHFS
jgi:hypothetical protein